MYLILLLLPHIVYEKRIRMRPNKKKKQKTENKKELIQKKRREKPVHNLQRQKLIENHMNMNKHHIGCIFTNARIQ